MRITDPEAVAGLQEALRIAGDTHTLGDVLRMVIDQRAQLWEGEKAVIVTEVHQTPQVKCIHFWLATGTLEDVIELSNLALDWAKSIGCTQATLTGRKGWTRAAPEGWRPLYTVLGREI